MLVKTSNLSNLQVPFHCGSAPECQSEQTHLHAWRSQPVYCRNGEAALRYPHVAMLVQIMGGLERMLSKLLSAEDAATASLQHAKFRSSEGLFSSLNAQLNAKRMPAWKWWESYGATVPELQGAAVKILSQCSSACSCERNWSTYGFVHSKSRNRLSPARARDLVYVFSNLRLIQRIEDAEYEEEYPEWDSSDEE